MKKRLGFLGVVALLISACGSEPPPPAMVQVPDVVGQTEGVAQTDLFNSKLRIDWEPSEVGRSRADIEEWVAISQQPLAGDKAEEWSDVVVQFQPIDDLDEEAPQTTLVDEVETAFADTYDWPDDPFWNAIESFHEAGSSRVAVATSLFPKDENEEVAMGLCRAVASVGPALGNDQFRKVHVTAGEGGAWLAECNVPQASN